MPTILFTRSIDNYHKSILKSNGFDFIEHDFLKIEPILSGYTHIEKELPNIKNPVFTSKHAVEIFFNPQPNLFDGFTAQSPSKFGGYNVFSTSGETKNALEKYGVSPTLSAPTAKQLAELMLLKADLTEGVHFICGNLSLSHLPDILEKQGIAVKKVEVYKTEKYPLSIFEHFDAVVFLSLSAADAFLEKNTLSAKTIVFTLGETTANHVRKKMIINSIFVAEKPTITSLVETICKTEFGLEPAKK